MPARPAAVTLHGKLADEVQYEAFFIGPGRSYCKSFHCLGVFLEILLLVREAAEKDGADEGGVVVVGEAGEVPARLRDDEVGELAGGD